MSQPSELPGEHEMGNSLHREISEPKVSSIQE